MSWRQMMGRTLVGVGVASLWLLVSTPLRAGSVSAELDRRGGTEDDRFRLTITVEGQAQEQPQLPAIEGLKVRFAGSSSSTHMDLTRGITVRSLQYSYLLVPERPGTFRIPSLPVEVDGSVERTEALTLVVRPSGESGDANPPLIAERSLSRTAAFVGEAIVAQARLYHRVRVHEWADGFEPPPTLRSIPLDDEQRGRKTIGDFTYGYFGRTYLLVPSAPGTIEVPRHEFAARVEGRRRRRRDPFSPFGGILRGGLEVVKRRTQPDTLEIKPLPQAGRPADFSGLVGEFDLRAEVSSRSVAVGETVTVTVRLRGDGLLDGISELPWASPAGVKVYPDKPTLRQEYRQGELIAERGFKFAVIPTEPGTVDLGAVSTTAFDPRRAQYVTLRAPLGALTVTGQAEALVAGGAASGVAKQSLRELGEDLIGPHRGVRVAPGVLVGGDSWWLALLGFGPLLLTGVAWAWCRSSQVDEGVRRRSQAWKRFRAQAAQVETDLAARADGAAVEAFAALVKTYFGDRLGLVSGALTPKDVEQQLQQHGVPRDLASRARDVLAVADAWQYSQGSSDTTPAEIVSRAREVIRDCERTLS